jgi:hypothetical protein
VPTYLITAPDGKKFRVTGEGTKEEALAHFQSKYSAPPQQEPPPPDPAADMGWGQKGLAGIGKAFSDLGRGTRQLSTEAGNAVGLGRLMPGNFGDQEVQRQRDEHAEVTQRDASLMDTRMGKAGNFVGNLAVAAPAAFIPGANTVAGAGLTGAAMGLAQPTDSGRAISWQQSGKLGR